nr:diguanylate cyclase [Frankia sp. R43]
MRLHAVAAPPDPRSRREGIPPGLANIVRTLLAKDPDDRFQCAEDLLAALGAVAELESPTAAAQPCPDGSADRLVGRAVWLEVLRTAWHRCRGGDGERTVVGVGGDAGLGKTHLVRTFVREACASPRTILMEAKCADLADAPFATFHALVDSYLRAPPAAGPTAEAPLTRLRAAAGDDAAALTHLHPCLGDPDRPRKPETVDVADTGVQLRLAAARFVRHLARLSGGLLLWVDDTQWLGAADRQLLEEIARDPAPAPLLVVATARDAAGLLSAGTSRRVAVWLEPLSEPEVAELIRSFLGDVADDRFVQDIAIRSSGSPLAVFEYVRAVIDAGLIQPSWSGFDLDREGFDSLALPDHVLGLIRRRVAALSPAALPLLRTAAAIGHQFDVDVLAASSGALPERVRLALADAEHHQLVTPAQGRWSFVHDCVREALLLTFGKDGLRRAHAAIADALEARGATCGTDLFAVARHAISGGLPAARQYRHTRAAAEAALAERAPVEAEDMFRAAAKAAERAGVAPDAAFETGFGLACSRRILPDQARVHFARALELESDALARAVLHAEAAGVEYGMRNYTAAATHVRQGLAEVGRPFPNSALVGPVALGRLLCAWIVRWPATGFGTATGETRRRYEIELRLHEVGGPNALFLFHVPSFLWHLSGLYAMRRVGIGELFIRGHVMINVAAAELGRGRAVRRSIDTFRALASKTGNPVLLAEVDLYAGIALQFLGETTAASEQLESTLRRAARWVDASLYDNAVTAATLDLSYRGFWREGLACLEPGANGINHVLNDLRITRCRLSRALGGAGERLGPALTELPPAEKEPVRNFFAYHGLMQNDLEEGRLGEDFDRLVTQADALGCTPLRTAKYYRYYWITRARGRLEQARLAIGDDRAGRVRVARRCLREALPAAVTPLFRADLLVLKAISDQLVDRPGRALRWLAAAERLALRLDAPRITFDVFVERARCLRSLGRDRQAREQARYALSLADGYGWVPRGRAVRHEFELSDSANSQVGKPAVVSSGRDRRRLDALLRVSAAADVTLDPDAVADIVLTEIIDILGADRAILLFPADPTGDGDRPHPHNAAALIPHAWRTAGEDAPMDLSRYARSIVARVHAEGNPLVVTGTSEGAALGSDSAVQHGLRSILAAPVPIEGRAAGVIYIDSQVAKGLFTEDDVDVLVTLAKQVGIALRTAEAARLQTRLATERRQRELAEVLREVAEQAGATLRSGDVLPRVLAAARPVLPHDAAWVLERRPQAMMRVMEVTGNVDSRAVGTVLPDPPAQLAPAFDGVAVSDTKVAVHLPGTPCPLTSWLALPVAPPRAVPTILVLASQNEGQERALQTEVARMVLDTAATAYENARLYEEARHSAATDPLTGLPNRRHFLEQARVKAGVRAQAGAAMSAMMIDVDRFKQVNDAHGHNIGDEVLVEIARRIERSLRSDDLAGRLGGEEFAVLVTGDAEMAYALGERVRLAVCTHPVPTSTGPLTITVSVGTASFESAESSIPAVLERADQSLYAAKRGGRNRTVTAEH